MEYHKIYLDQVQDIAALWLYPLTDFQKRLKLNFWLALNILLKTLLSQFQKCRLGIILTQKRGTNWRVNILVLAVNHIENKNPENHNALVLLKWFLCWKVSGADQESFSGLGKL